MKKLLIFLLMFYPLILEGQRTISTASNYVAPVVVANDFQNLFKYSEALDNDYWDKVSSVTILADQEVDLDGNTTIDRITTADDYSKVYSSDSYAGATVTAGTNYTFSFDCKRGTMTALNWAVYDITGDAYTVAATSYYAATSSSLQRVSVTFTTAAGCTEIRVNVVFNCESQGTVFIGRLQLRETAHAAGYIKTEGTIIP